MSLELTKNIENLSVKIQELVEKYDFLLAENNVLRNEILHLKSNISDKDKQITQFQTEIQTLRVAKTIQGNDYNKDTNLKINKLIKEIDWCIEQLSD